MKETKEEILLLKTILLAGRLMSESGSEAYRVEDTMNHIAQNAGRTDCVNYVTLTGLFVSLKEEGLTQIENVMEREINIEKVNHVNHLSRQFQAKEIDLAEFYQKLLAIQKEVPDFTMPLKLLSAGVVSATLMYIFGGTWYDFIATFFIGILGYYVSFISKKWLKALFINDFLAAFVIGVTAYLAVKFSLGQSVDNIIIGSVMPLVPGVAITNSFRDILAGHLLNGTARMMEAIFTAAAIAVGIAITFKIFL